MTIDSLLANDGSPYESSSRELPGLTRFSVFHRFVTAGYCSPDTSLGALQVCGVHKITVQYLETIARVFKRLSGWPEPICKVPSCPNEAVDDCHGAF